MFGSFRHREEMAQSGRAEMRAGLTAAICGGLGVSVSEAITLMDGALVRGEESLLDTHAGRAVILGDVRMAASKDIPHVD